MTREGPVAGFRWTHFNAQGLGQLASAVLPSGAQHAFTLGATQAGDEVLAQLASAHGVTAVVDGLMRDGALEVVGPHELECASDLKRRPALLQKVAHDAREQSVREQLRAVPGFEALKASPGPRIAGILGARLRRLRLGRSHRFCATLLIGKTIELAGNARGRAMQGACDMARRELLLTHDHNGDSFLKGEVYLVCPYDSTLLGGCCN